jgi:hypothetical protein
MAPAMTRYPQLITATSGHCQYRRTRAGNDGIPELPDLPTPGHLLSRPSMCPCENVRMDGLACPCGLGDDYESCCGRLRAGAPTPVWTTELGGRRHCTRLRIAGNTLARDATTRPDGVHQPAG